MAREYGYNLDLLDIGGGFPGYPNADEPTFAELADKINQALDTCFSDMPTLKVRFYCINQ